jgi:hypothetical protein
VDFRGLIEPFMRYVQCYRLMVTGFDGMRWKKSKLRPDNNSKMLSHVIWDRNPLFNSCIAHRATTLGPLLGPLRSSPAGLLTGMAPSNIASLGGKVAGGKTILGVAKTALNVLLASAHPSARLR